MARGVAVKMTLHVGPQAACDLHSSSSAFSSGSAHVWAFPPRFAGNGARRWLEGRASRRSGGVGAVHWPGLRPSPRPADGCSPDVSRHADEAGRGGEVGGGVRQCTRRVGAACSVGWRSPPEMPNWHRVPRGSRSRRVRPPSDREHVGNGPSKGLLREIVCLAAAHTRQQRHEQQQGEAQPQPAGESPTQAPTAPVRGRVCTATR